MSTFPLCMAWPFVWSCLPWGTWDKEFTVLFGLEQIFSTWNTATAHGICKLVMVNNTGDRCKRANTAKIGVAKELSHTFSFNFLDSAFTFKTDTTTRQSSRALAWVSSTPHQILASVLLPATYQFSLSGVGLPTSGFSKCLLIWVSTRLVLILVMLTCFH